MRLNHCDSEGVFPRTGSGLPGVEGDGFTDGATAGCAADEAGEAAGVADAPGCVPGCAPGGLAAAAGCARFSDSGPATEIGFGVPLGWGVGEAGGAGVAAPLGACEACGVGTAIGFAGAGFCFANSATASCIARSIGIRAIPLFLSI